MRHVDAKLVQGVRKRATPASERKGGGGGHCIRPPALGIAIFAQDIGKARSADTGGQGHVTTKSFRACSTRIICTQSRASACCPGTGSMNSQCTVVKVLDTNTDGIAQVQVMNQED